jgi:Tfp pilus assembly PilM family ATPase
VSPEERTGQKHKLQSSSKALLKDKEIVMAKEKAVGPDQLAQKLRSLFKGQFISCKSKQQENSGQSLQEWLQ